jgi:hypothetical protein
MRSKLKLGLDELAVETFELGVTRSMVGTVRAHDSDVMPGDGEGEGDTIEKVTCALTQCGSSCYSCPTGLGPVCCV